MCNVGAYYRGYFVSSTDVVSQTRSSVYTYPRNLATSGHRGKTFKMEFARSFCLQPKMQ
jgi:hypothetical protein